MEFWIFIACAVLVVLIVPYIRLVIKRISLAVRVKRACRENGFTFRPAHPFWMFGRNNSGHCDFYCISEKDSRMYSVKLFASLHRLADLTFFDDRNYRTKRYFALGGRGRGFSDSIVWEKESRIKKLRETDWYYGTEDDYTHRNVPVLLVNPVPMKIYRSKIVPLQRLERAYVFCKKEETTVANTQVYDGDFIYDAYLFSASSFTRELDHSCIF
ncbi:MAG: hypothetical protein IJF78_16445 [Clostridia bacterium]|nr:hypothetical protein [Clostridia bacterium]